MADISPEFWKIVDDFDLFITTVIEIAMSPKKKLF